MSYATNNPVRSKTQLAFYLLLFSNAALALLFSLPLLAFWDSTLAVGHIAGAIFISINPAMALASIVSPVLTLKRSALGLVLAWAILPVLLIDGACAFWVLDSLPFLAVKLLCDGLLLIALLVLLCLRSAYRDLDPKSYGFPVIARFAPGEVCPTESPLTASPMISTTPANRPIKEALMQSFIRAANAIRLTAIIFRILIGCLLVLDFLYIAWLSYRLTRELMGGGGYSHFGSRFPVEMLFDHFGFLSPTFVPFTVLLLLFFSTFILSALGEILRCQATVAQSHPASQSAR